MTARKKTPNVQRTAAHSAADDQDSEFDQETVTDIEQFLSGQSEQSTVTIYRVGKAGERDGFLDIMSATGMQTPGPEQVLRDNYGAGHYRLKLKAPNKAGVLKYAGMKTITIADRPAGAAGNGNGASHGTDGYLRDELSRQHNLVLAMIASNKPQGVDFAGLAALITALSGGNNKQSDLGAVVQAFTMLKASAEPGNGLAQVKDVLEIAKSISGGGAAPAGGDEPDTSWSGIIKGVLGAFGGAAAAQQPQRMIPARTPGPAQPAGAGDDDEQPGDEEMFQQILGGQLAFLKTKVRSNKPVEWWIQYAIDNAEETGMQVLFTALRGGATFEHLLQFDPTIASDPVVRVWFQKFYDGLKGSLQPPAVIPWIVGNNANPAGNAVPGTDRQPQPGDPPSGGNPGQP